MTPEFVIQSEKISSHSYLPEVGVILVSSSAGKVSFFSFETQRSIYEFNTGEKDLLTARAFFTGEPEVDSWTQKVRIVCQFKSGDVVLYSISDKKVVKLWKASTYCFAKLFFDTSGGTFSFLSGENAGTSYQIVDTRTLEAQSLTFDGTSHGIITSTRYWTEPERAILLLGDETGSLTLYEHVTGKGNALTKVSSQRLFDEILLCFDYHQESRVGVAGSVTPEVVLWKLGMDLEIQQTKRISLPNSSMLCCAIRPDGRLFAVADKSGQFRLMTTSGKLLTTVPFHSCDIKAISFEPIDGKDLLFVSDNHLFLSVWSLYNNTKDTQ